MMHEPTPEGEPSADAFVELQRVTHTYGRGDRRVHALDATDLWIEKGDFMALVDITLRATMRFMRRCSAL